jgi:hypothetical protein
MPSHEKNYQKALLIGKAPLKDNSSNNNTRTSALPLFHHNDRESGNDNISRLRRKKASLVNKASTIAWIELINPNIKSCNGVDVSSAAIFVESTSSYALRRVCAQCLVACGSPR